LVLPEASCESCRVKTGQFEQIVARDMYWPLRLRLGVRGRRRKQRITHWQGVVIDDDTGIETPVAFEVEKIPRIYVVAEFPSPGILKGLIPIDSNPEFKLHLKGDKTELQQFMVAMGVAKQEVVFDWHWGPFNRLLAKIAHAYAVASLGLDGFEHFLPPLIVGDAPYFSHLELDPENETVG
jgi:hypothetical protein